MVDGTAFYVRGSLTRMDAFLLFTAIRVTNTGVNAFIIHFHSHRALSAKNLDGAVRMRVKANIVRRRLALVAASKTRPSTVPAAKAPPAPLAAIVLPHERRGSQALFWKMRRTTGEPGWSWTELRAAKANMFPKNNRQLLNVKLLAQLSGLLLHKRKGLVAGHRQYPHPCGDNSRSGCVW